MSRLFRLRDLEKRAGNTYVVQSGALVWSAYPSCDSASQTDFGHRGATAAIAAVPAIDHLPDKPASRRGTRTKASEIVQLIDPHLEHR